MLKWIVCDWNRTLFEDYYEESFFQVLYKSKLKSLFKKTDILGLLRLLTFSISVKKLFALAKKEADVSKKTKYIKAVIDIINENLIKGIDSVVLNRNTDVYCRDQAVLSKLDKRMLDPLKLAQTKFGVKIGILSSGYEKGIKNILENEGYFFDFVSANSFVADSAGRLNFKLKVLTNKGNIFRDFLVKEKIRRDEIIYIGDDWWDKDCFEAVDYSIISFMAKADIRDSFSAKYGALIPKSSRDIFNYITSIV